MASLEPISPPLLSSCAKACASAFSLAPKFGIASYFSPFSSADGTNVAPLWALAPASSEHCAAMKESSDCPPDDAASFTSSPEPSML